MANMTIKTTRFLISPTKEAGLYDVQKISYVVPGIPHPVYSRPMRMAIPAELLLPTRCRTIFDEKLDRFINKEIDRRALESLERTLSGGADK